MEDLMNLAMDGNAYHLVPTVASASQVPSKEKKACL